MNHYKKVLSIALVGLLAAGMLAGGQGGGTSSSTAEAAPSEAGASSEAAAPAEDAAVADSGEPVSLSMYAPGTGELDLAAYDKVFELYKAEAPNVSVELTQIPWGEYFTKLNVSFSGGTAPDIYGVGLGQIGPVQVAGNMLELNPHLEGWDGWDDIPENVLSLATKDGKLYGNPMLELRVLYYRKDLFEAAGLTEPPKTLDELESYAKQLVQTDGGKISISGLDIGTGEQTLFTVMLMFGADKFWNEDLTSAMLEPNAIEALDWCRNLMVNGISDHGIMHNIEGTKFENGIAAMSLDGSAGIATMLDKLGADKVGVAPLPSDKNMAGTTCWSVYTDTKHVDEAVGLWKMLASKEGQLIIAENIGFVPTRTSAKDEYIALRPEYNEVFFDAASKATPYGVLNQYFFEFVNNIRPLIDEVYYGNKTSVEAMEEFEGIYNQAVEEAKAG